MTILVCDDDRDFYLRLKSILCKNRIFADSEFIYCKDGLSIVEEYKTQNPDLIFMDIELGDILGFDIVRELLSQGYLPKVIYITAYSHYVFDSFIGQPLGFVRKSCLETDLELALAEVERIFYRKNKSIIIKSGVSDYELYLYKISGIEIFGHNMIIHYSNKSTLTVRYTLSKIEKQTADYDFIRINRNTLVNMNYVKNMSGKQLVMKDGTIIYVTPNRIPDTQNAIKKYSERGI